LVTAGDCGVGVRENVLCRLSLMVKGDPGDIEGDPGKVEMVNAQYRVPLRTERARG
jgi:hypothetical protein